MDRADIVHENFLRRVAQRDWPAPDGVVNGSLTLSPESAVQIFRSQITSRQLDRMSRKLQARGEAFYTIGSSGHEGMAAVAAALRPDDMAFLHYRDAAFQIERSKQVPGQTILWDMLLSFASSSDDPISGGRHKVLGSSALNIPPQTSTISSHLPKAMGAAYSIGAARRLTPEHKRLADDGIIVCSFGDASLNHSTALGAINAAGWTERQGAPMPLLFVCEDNGIGISTKSPTNWVSDVLQSRPGVAYFTCDGLNIDQTHQVAIEAAHFVRRRRKPAILHFGCVRLYGHAGADAQAAYLSKKEIEGEEAKDPLLHTAQILECRDILSSEEILGIYNEIGDRTARAAEEAIKRPRLKTAKDVMASIVPPRRECATLQKPAAARREEVFGTSDMRAMQQPQHMAKLINFTLTDLMLEHEEIVLAGEDIGPKGGVYGVTQRLHQRYGPARVINTLLDEQTILGLSIGLAHNGILPIPEIQFLAYLHNAEDQLRGEASTLSFFSNGQYTNPMVVRVAGLGYQRGFGGHFHNDNSLAVLRDLPGVIVACPSNGHDAALMLRECVRLAREEQRVVVFIEPIALYMTRDLHDEGDGLWTYEYPLPHDDTQIMLGEVGVHGDGEGLAIITYGNGHYLSRQAEKKLRENHHINARVIDLRWIAPLPEQALMEAIAPCRKVLVVDECRKSGSASEALVTLLVERGLETNNIARLTAEDCFIATGPAFSATLPSTDVIVDTAINILAKGV